MTSPPAEGEEWGCRVFQSLSLNPNRCHGRDQNVVPNFSVSLDSNFFVVGVSSPLPSLSSSLVEYLLKFLCEVGFGGFGLWRRPWFLLRGSLPNLLLFLLHLWLVFEDIFQAYPIELFHVHVD